MTTVSVQKNSITQIALIALLTASSLLTVSCTGPRGPQGPSGVSAAAVDEVTYGDGSAGALVIAVNTDWRFAGTPRNLQFTTITINPGVTLRLPSGMILRATGTVVNNGDIIVHTAAKGGTYRGFGPSEPLFSAPDAGLAMRAASNGSFGDNTVLLAGGLGGQGLNSAISSQVLNPGLKGGGGGGVPGISGLDRFGVSGGGTLVILAKGGIWNPGTISADGDFAADFGGGGGGGGVIILASDSGIDVSGAIYADGGDGGDSDSETGAGGGGGGGIIHLMSPFIDDTGSTITVFGGFGGASVGSVTSVPRSSGGGGGASGGSGGAGGNVTTANTAVSSSSGNSGYIFETLMSPSAFY